MIYTFNKYIIRVSLLAIFMAFSIVSWGTELEKEEVAAGITLKFELVDGLIVVQASKDGHSGNYILDTGAPHLMVNQKVDKEDFQLWTVKGSQKGEKIDITTFEFGTILRQDVEAWAMDLTYIEDMIGRPVAGILGHTLLKEYCLEIDYQLKEINLIADRRRYTNSSVDYNVTSISIANYADHLPIVEIDVEGVNKKLVFDTGAAISVLNKSDVESTTSKSIAINNIRIDNAPFCNRDLSELTSNETIDGILSVSSLDAAKVLIDHSSGRIFLFWSKEKI